MKTYYRILCIIALISPSAGYTASSSRVARLESIARYLCCLKKKPTQGPATLPYNNPFAAAGSSTDPQTIVRANPLSTAYTAGTKAPETGRSAPIPSVLQALGNARAKAYNESYYPDLSPLEPFYHEGSTVGEQKDYLNQRIEWLSAQTELSRAEQTELAECQKRVKAYWTLRRGSCTCDTEYGDILAQTLHAALLKRHYNQTLNDAQRNALNEEIEALYLRLGEINSLYIHSLISHDKDPLTMQREIRWMEADVLLRLKQEVLHSQRTVYDDTSDHRMNLAAQQEQLSAFQEARDAALSQHIP
jgi:hypothetical protein